MLNGSEALLNTCNGIFNGSEALHCLRRRDTQRIELSDMGYQDWNSGLCQYAVCITQNTYNKK